MRTAELAPRMAPGSHLSLEMDKAPGAVAWGFVVWGYQELNLGPHPYQP